MELEGWIPIAAIAGGTVLFFMLVGFALARFYQRASADEAIIRTGARGEHVSIGGGMLVLPILHQVMRVSLRTVTLTVERSGSNALVTKDKIKACCTMELYIKVDPTKEAITAAARSFGTKNVDATALSDIVEGKLTDALRGVAANQNFAELHANRDQFAEKVKEALVNELKKNGLKLESTSLTQLSQLPTSEMDPNDVFDAEGLRNIARTVSKAQEEANQIERTKEVTIQKQNVEARDIALQLEQKRKFLEADQSRKVAEYQATQAAEEKMAILAQEQAAKEAEQEQKRVVDSAIIAQEEAISTRDLERQRVVAEADAAKQEAEKTAMIRAQKAVEEATIERQKTIEAATIEKQRVIETANIEKQVAIARADTEKARAEAEKALAEAEEAAAREKIATAEETVRAERIKAIAVIKAREEAEESKINDDRQAYTAKIRAEADLVVKQNAAQAEKETALGLANAVRERAEAEADKRRVEAQAIKDAADLEAEANAVKIRVSATARAEAATLDAQAKIELAEALLKEGDAQAEARRKMVEAENYVDSRLLILEATKKAIDVSPDVVREFVKSAEAFSDFKVVQISGLGGSGENGDAGALSEFTKTPFGLGLTTLAQGTALLPLIKALMEVGGVNTEELKNRAVDTVKTLTRELTARNKGGIPAETLSSRGPVNDD